MNLYKVKRYESALANVRKELDHMATVPVYFAQAEKTGEVKIGFSTQVYNRIYLLSHHRFQTVNLLGWVLGGPKVEREMHERFAEFALGGEWFVPGATLLEFIDTSTRHDEAPHVASPYGRITDWGYDNLVGDEQLYLDFIAEAKAA